MEKDRRIILYLSTDEYELIVDMATEKQLTVSELVILSILALV